MLEEYAVPATIVSRVKSTQRSLDGNDKYTTTQTATTGWFGPTGSTEITQGRDTVTTHDTFYILAGSPVPTAEDQMIVGDTTYEVNGKPAVYPLGASVSLLEVSG